VSGNADVPKLFQFSRHNSAGRAKKPTLEAHRFRRGITELPSGSASPAPPGSKRPGATRHQRALMQALSGCFIPIGTAELPAVLL
jgi:hypothetical protein